MTRQLRSAIFLDRDGTLLKERGYLSNPKKINFYPKVFTALRRLQSQGFKLVVLTNQSGLARGYLSLTTLNEIHRNLKKILMSKGVRLSGLYYCPHSPHHGCSCRKPKTALPKRAARDLKLKLSTSYVIGDQNRDLKLARRIKAKGVLVLTGSGPSLAKKDKRLAQKIARNLDSASRWIIRDQKRG